MTDNWAEWEGRTVDGKYLLRNYLGGSGGRAVFHARANTEPADVVVKLIAADNAEAEGQRLRWDKARELSHPNLIRILAIRHAVADGREFFYAVEEFAEENLAQIVPERALTAEEVRGMLYPVVAALEYLHGKGLVHGRIRPANILAARDQVKLSSDSLRKAGDVPRAASAYDAPEVAARGISTASDVWSLGATLVEVMTQYVPVWDAARMSAADVGGEIPEPFRGIVGRCLEIDPRKRCGLREIRDRLERGEAGPTVTVGEKAASDSITAQKSSLTWAYGLLLVAVIGVAGFLLLRPHRPGAPAGEETPASQPTVVQHAPSGIPPAQTGLATPQAPPKAGAVSRKAQGAGAQPLSAQPEAAAYGATAPQTPAEGRTAAPAAGSAAKNARAEEAPQDDVVLRVMPEVAPSARRTIEGRIRVRTKVDVDADGNVTEVRLTDAGPSKYFARVALEGARRWKFAPAPDQGEKREWTLLFVFTRARTEATATQARGN